MKRTAAENSREQQKGTAGWHFRDLLVWQKAMTLARDVYQVSGSFPKSEVFGLTAQIRRAAVSVPSNIAEGCGRVSPKGMKVFFGHARGSVYEVETQLRIAESLSFLEGEANHPLIASCWEISRMLNALIIRLEESSG